MTNIIEIENLKKNYDDVSAVKSVSMSVEKGKMFGLVGPDGAGKTTTIRVLCGLIPPDNGEITMMGMNLFHQRKEIQKNIGYLSQKFSLYGDLTIDENIEFFADIHNVKNFEKRRDELLEFTRLTPFRDRLADNLSGGMKQKLALACSLIHKPKILFLDEPTTGVDPVSRRDFWKILSSLMSEGITIFMTTPYLDEAERCNTVALMNKGEIIALDSPKSIKEQIDKEFVEVVCSPVRIAYGIIKNRFDFEVQIFGDRLTIITNNYKLDFPMIEKNLKENGVKIESHRSITPSLENVFITLIKKAG